MINRQNVEDVYSLSPMQQGMLFHSLYTPDSGIYVEQMGLEISGPLNFSALAQAWQRCIDHHAILRTAFVWEKLAQPLQVVGRQVTLKIDQQDWQSLSEEVQKSQLDDWFKADQAQGFVVSKAPLMRLTLIQLGPERCYFIWSHHHLLLDGWSAALLLEQVWKQYETICKGQMLSLEPTRPYRAYILWLQQQDYAIAQRFWKQSLKGFTNPTLISGHSHRSERGTPDSTLHKTLPRHVEQTIQLTAATTTQLQNFVQHQRLTLNTLIQGAWAILLSRYSGETDVVFGTTVSGRSPSLTGAESMVGLLINTLPVRTQIEPQMRVIDWLQQFQIRQAEARQYDYMPLSQLQQWSEVEAGVPLFESLLIVENYPKTLELKEGNVRICPVRMVERTNYPMTVVAEPGDRLTIKLVYNRDRFNDELMTRFGKHLQTLLETIPTNASHTLSALSILTPAERQQLLVTWNQTALSVPNVSIHRLFEKQVEKTPDAIALVFQNTQPLTYQALNQQANQFAHYLQTLGIEPDMLVGLSLERSPLMLIALLGILKAGGAYVPLDPSYPLERLRFMIEDSQTALLVTQTSLSDQLAVGIKEQPHPPKVLCLDTDWDLISQQPQHNPVTSVTPQNLAYVIYTSGSTGTPKGVMVEHHSVVNFLWSLQQHLLLQPADRLLAVTTLSFDIAVLELLLPLTTGALVAIASQSATKDAVQLIAALEVTAATVMQATPSTWQMLLSAGWRGKADLKALSGGEALSHDLAKQLLNRGATVWNLYGPTETTIWSTLHQVTDSTAPIPIGHPIHNTKIYLLDQHLQPVPIGVPGEIHIGGDGLARGYWQRPELTATRFITNPFETNRAARRLYKTEDLACYRADGQLEHLGRLDHQIKLRGYRIELGEIEAVLRQQPGVKDAVVIVREDNPGDQRLVGYGVFPEATTSTTLRKKLQLHLPEHMVPSAIVRLKTLPLTPNGKVDRKALPQPDFLQPIRFQETAPQTETERQIAEIWKQVLQTNQVGRDDNFFELGGHSLLATQVISRLRQSFEQTLPIRVLFESPTISALARQIEKSSQTPQPSEALALLPVNREQPLPLSFAQERLWILDQLEPGDPSYNISTAVKLTGALNIPAFEQSLNAVIQRHESLRTTFELVDGVPVQAIAPHLSLSIQHTDLSHLPQNQQQLAMQQFMQAESQQPFYLAQGPLLRAQLLHLAESNYVLLFSLHHIIADAWSMGVLLKEVTTGYQALVQEKTSQQEETSTPKNRPKSPALPIQYADFSVWQRQWLQASSSAGLSPLQQHLDYWQSQLQGPLPVLQLPTDFPRPAKPTTQGALHAFTLPPGLSASLHLLSQQQEVSLFMSLLAAFQILLYRYTQEEDMIVGTDVANRNRTETEALIGFLVNILVLRTDLSGNPTFQSLLNRVREVTLGAYEHQDLPFAKLVDALKPERSLNHTPLFQVLFVLQNTPMPPLELAGLTLTPLEIDNGTAKFDLALFLTETDQGIQGLWNYRTDLFKPETIQRFSQTFTELLQQIVSQPQAHLSDLVGSVPAVSNAFPPDPAATFSNAPANTMTATQRKSRKFKKFKAIQLKPVHWLQDELIETSHFSADPSLPLVIQPKAEAVDLDEWAQNHRPWLEKQLQQHCAILFRGFEVPSATDFEQVAQSICPALFGDYGDLPREGMGGKVYGATPYPADQAIRFHNESSHLSRWPMKIWFFCVQAAQKGGKTPIVDCRKAYQRLNPRLRQHLQDKQLMYVRNFTDGLDVSWQQFFQTADRAAVESECRRHQMQVEWTARGLRTRQIRPAVLQHPKTEDWLLFNQIQLHHVNYLKPAVRQSLLSVLEEANLPRHVYYGDGSPIEETVLAELDAVYEYSKTQFAWQEQDVLMLDNMLAAHGRNSFEGPRKIVVTMGEMISDRDLKHSRTEEASHATTR